MISPSRTRTSHRRRPVDVLWFAGGHPVRNQPVVHLGNESPACRGNTTPLRPQVPDRFNPRNSTGWQTSNQAICTLSTEIESLYYGYALYVPCLQKQQSPLANVDNRIDPSKTAGRPQ